MFSTSSRVVRVALISQCLAACSLTPVYVRPTLPTPSAFPGIQLDQGPSVAHIGWRAFFPDPELSLLVEEALANNRDLRIAVGRVEQAHATFRIQASQLYPSLDAVASLTRSRTPADLSYTGRAYTASDYQSVLNVGWELDFWGRVRSLRASALESFLATDEARRATIVSLIAEVANGYLMDCAYEERIALAGRTIVSRQESLRIARRRFEVGASSKLDMTQAQSLVGQAQTDIEALAQSRAINLDALALLVGRQIVVPPSSRRLSELDLARAIPPGLPSGLLVDRPDVLAAEHRLIAAHADIGAARAAFFPKVTLTGAGGSASSELGGLFAGGSGVWSFAPTISLPIFHGGYNRGQLESAQAARRIATADYERTIQGAFRDVADALAKRRWLSSQISTTEGTLAALTERARLADLRYTSGRALYLEVLDAQRDLFTTEQALVQLRQGFLSSGIDLYAAVGGGAPDYAPTAARNGPTS